MNKLYTYAVYVSNDQTLGCSIPVLRIFWCNFWSVLCFYMFTIQHNGHVALQGIVYFFNRLFCIHSILDCLKKKDFLQMMSKQHSDEINSESLMEAFKIFDKVRWRDHLFPLNYIKSQSSFSSWLSTSFSSRPLIKGTIMISTMTTMTSLTPFTNTTEPR